VFAALSNKGGVAVVSVTTEAKDLLQDILQQAQQQGAAVDEDTSIRLAPTTEGGDGSHGQVGLGLMLDRPQEGDQVVEHNGKKVLVIDSSTSDLLNGVTLDAVDTPEGKRLTINR
jgi:Fe-S cluster assembly iron-binding protein IscA